LAKESAQDSNVTLSAAKGLGVGRNSIIDCFRCGICCTRYQPKLTPQEIRRIAKSLSLSTEDFLAQYVQITTIGYLLKQSAKGCIFLKWEEGKTSCEIYHIRPKACRDWTASLSQPECRQGLARLKTHAPRE